MHWPEVPIFLSRLERVCVCATIKAMLLPRFSILWMLGFTAFCAVVSLVLANAVRGEFWAIGAMAALGSGVLLVRV